MPLRKGSCLAALLAVICIIVLLGAVFVFIVAFSRSSALPPLANCTSNLKGIGTAIQMYDTSLGKFPVHTTVGTTAAENFTGAATVPLDRIWDKNNDGVKDDWALTENPMDNIWLLVAQGTASAGMFQCPSFRSNAEYPDTSQAGWTDLHQFSYGMHDPYSDNNNITTVSGSFVIMADQNPTNDWGRNHRGDVIFLKADGSVNRRKAKDKTAYLAGIDDDNIYEAVANAIPLTTSMVNDTYIVPKAAR